MEGVAASVVVDNVLSEEDEIFTPASFVEDTEESVLVIEDVEEAGALYAVEIVLAVEDVVCVATSVEIDVELVEEDVVGIEFSVVEDTEPDEEDAGGVAE